METFIKSMVSIKKECEAERDPVIRNALLALFKAHDHECTLYFKQPDAHPDYKKEYKMFVQRKTEIIMELGGNPNNVNFHDEWKVFWPVEMCHMFKVSWKEKKKQCLLMMTKRKNRLKSKSSSDTSSSSDSDDSDPKKSKKLSKKKKSRHSKSKHASEAKHSRSKKLWKPIGKPVEERSYGEIKMKPVGRVKEQNLSKRRKLEQTQTGTMKDKDLTLELDLQNYRNRKYEPFLQKYDHTPSHHQPSMSHHQSSRSHHQPSKLHHQPSVSGESSGRGSSLVDVPQIVDLLKVLNYMKDKFGDLENSFNNLFRRAVLLKEMKVDSNVLLNEKESCSILEQLGKRIQFILRERSLNTTQHVIAQEIFERFGPFLLKVTDRKPPYGSY